MSQFVYVDPSPPPPAFSSSYVTSYVSTTAGTTHTFTGCSIGSAASGRRVLVGVTGHTGVVAYNFNGGTIAGGAATSSANTEGNYTHAAFMYAQVDSGTTATITITYNVSVAFAAIHIFALYDLASGTPTDTARVFSSAATAIDVSAGGTVFGVGINDTAGVTWTATGVVENTHADFSTDSYCVASVMSALGQTAMPVRLLPSTVLRTTQSYVSFR